LKKQTRVARFGRLSGGDSGLQLGEGRVSNPTDDWLAALPNAFLTYQGSGRIEEVECIIPDIAGLSRGKSMPLSKFDPQGTYMLPDSLFYQTITGAYVDIPAIDNQWMESDVVLRPDMSTASAVPWATDISLQVIADLETLDGAPLAVSPRNVLRRVLGLYRDKGWKPVVAPELEFYLTKPNLDPNEPIAPAVGRTGRAGVSSQSYSMVAVDEFGPIIDTIYGFAAAQGLMIDAVIQEGGAGQIEINLMHGDPLNLADQVFYFKRTIREAALRHGSFATFMAKPMRGQPGSAMHVHQSVVDAKTGQNIFSNLDGSPSAAFRHFIGGSQSHLKSTMPLLAPYVNSYRRFTAGMSAPVNLEWGTNNRTVGLRIPNAPSAARRVENRVIGIDSNPYLAIASSLACGYLGLVNRMEPSPEAKGEVYEEGAVLPRNLTEALDGFDADTALHAVLGPEFCQLYSAIKKAEIVEFESEISPWERQHLLLSV
jgi:glutamine synthetase